MEIRDDAEYREDERYAAPQIRSLGSVEEMTNQELDKIGSTADIFTPTVPLLDGFIQPDP